MSLFRHVIIGFCMALFVVGVTTVDVRAQGCSEAVPGDEPFPCCSSFTVPSGGSDDERTCVGPATSYIFQIQGFGFEDSLGNITEMGSPTEFDGASVSAGETMGSFIAGGTLADGTYVAVRPSVNKTFTVTANITTLDNRSCTGTASGQMEGNDGDYAVCGAGEPTGNNQCLDGDVIKMRTDELGNMIHTAADPIGISFAFYTDNSARCTFPAGGTGDGVLSLGGLKVSMIVN